MRIRHLSTVLPLVLLAACSGGTDKAIDDTAVGDDTGTLPPYPEGCITVDGGGGYLYLADALTVADAGAVIMLCAGELEESVTIDKAVTIRGPGTSDLLWTGEVNYPVIHILGATGVELSGFSLVSTRNGIDLEGATDTIINDVVFENISGTGVRAVDSENTQVGGCTFKQPGGIPEVPDTGDTGDAGDTGEEEPADTGEENPSLAGDTAHKDTANGTGDTGDTGQPVDPTDDWIGYGGVEISGGSATVSLSLFTQLIGFAVHAVEGADVTVESSTISWVVYGEANEDGSVSDGFALWPQSGSTLHTSNNSLQSNFVGIFSDEGNLDLSGDDIYGGLYGVYSVLGDATIDGLTITDAYFNGMTLLGRGNELVVTDTTVSGDPDVVYLSDAESGNSIGINVAADSVSFTDVTVYGYNLLGMALDAYDSNIEAELTRVRIENAGRYGLRMQEGDYTLTDVWVTGLRLVDDPSLVNTGGSISTGFAASAWYSTVTWAGGGVSDSEFIGILNAFSDFTLEANESGEGVTFDSNWYHGIWNYEGTATIRDATFTNSAGYYAHNPSLYPYTAALYNTNATVVVEDSSWIDNLESRYSEYVDEFGAVQGTEYLLRSKDIISALSTMTVDNCTFENGSYGMEIYGGDVEISSSTWDNYNQYVIYTYNQDVGTPLVVTDVEMTNVGGDAIYCSNGEIEIDGLNIDTGTGVEISYIYTQDGVETGSFSYNYYDDMLYTYACQVYASNVQVSNSPDQPMTIYMPQVLDENGDVLSRSVELYSVYVSDSGGEGSSSSGAVHVNFSGASLPEFYAQDIQVTNAGAGYGLYVLGSDSNETGGTIEVSNVMTTDGAGSGIVISNLNGGDYQFNNLTSSGNGGSGMAVWNSTVSVGFDDGTDGSANLQGLVSESNDGDGLSVISSTLTLAHSDLGSVAGGDGNQGNGLDLSSSTAVVVSATANSNVGSGIGTDASDLDLTDVEATGNGGYAIECTNSPTFSSCTGGSFDNNTTGDFSQCDIDDDGSLDDGLVDDVCL